jgi:hypothetical protein
LQFVCVAGGRGDHDVGDVAGDHAKQASGTSDEPAGHAHSRIVEPDRLVSCSGLVKMETESPLLI